MTLPTKLLPMLHFCYLYFFLYIDITFTLCLWLPFEFKEHSLYYVNSFNKNYVNVAAASDGTVQLLTFNFFHFDLWRRLCSYDYVIECMIFVHCQLIRI